jgi:hypothetical protein
MPMAGAMAAPEAAGDIAKKGMWTMPLLRAVDGVNQIGDIVSTCVPILMILVILQW